MKHFAAALGLGLLALALVFGFMSVVSLDVRLVFAVGVLALFASGLWLGRSPRRSVWTWLLLTAPLAIGFGSVALRELPFLWPHVALWALCAAAGIGWVSARHAGRRRHLAAAGVLALGAVGLWYGTRYLPAVISKTLTRLRNDPAPSFALSDLDGRPIDAASWRDKVVVLDFFSTYCAPCVAELPQLQRARAELRSPDIVFLVVANDSGGDDPAAVRAFAAKRGIDLAFAWDPGSVVHKAFGFTGLPALVVLDRAGRVRMRHEGYNAADVNFRDDLERFAASLMRGAV
ncbi:MAG TPA: TlpA disulfide reductase family protein [Thermoanaerobaculia bacterium]